MKQNIFLLKKKNTFSKDKIDFIHFIHLISDMFKFNSFTPELPINSPPEINNHPNHTLSNSTPIIHINNLTINVTPSQVVDCLKEIITPKTYDQLPTDNYNRSITNQERSYIQKQNDWYEKEDINYNYDNCNACIMPNKKLMLNIKKSNKPSPLELYKRNKTFKN
jgi:hypothetical protein